MHGCDCLAERVAMVCHQVWVDLQSSIIALNSLRNEALLHQSTGHVVVSICEAWLQAQRRLHALSIAYHGLFAAQQAECKNLLCERIHMLKIVYA